MSSDPESPEFFDSAATEKELTRITEICDGCRRCLPLCTSFEHMLNRVDAHEGDLSKLLSGDYRRIVDLCWQCKLCYNHCPYTPPHRWQIDFPRLMLRAKAARAKDEGVTRSDRWLGNVDAVGRLGSATAPLSNWANAFAPQRALMEAVIGIDKTRNLPRFHRTTFERWFRKRGAKVREGNPVAFFFSCSVNYNEPQIGRDAVSVLEKNQCEIDCPAQVCCGMPYLDGGDIEAARRSAKRNIDSLLPAVERGAKVVVPQPTCSYVLKNDYPDLVPGEAAQKVSEATRDLFEFLVERHKAGALDTDFPGARPGKVAYQVPCHLRAQNMGFKTRDVLELVPDTKVAVVEECTAMDGTWGMKKEYYPLSLKYAKRAAKEMESSEPDVFATDCSMSALQLEAARGKKPEHPITLLRKAYGLDEES